MDGAILDVQEAAGTQQYEMTAAPTAQVAQLPMYEEAARTDHDVWYAEWR